MYSLRQPLLKEQVSISPAEPSVEIEKKSLFPLAILISVPKEIFPPLPNFVTNWREVSYEARLNQKDNVRFVTSSELVSST